MSTFPALVAGPWGAALAILGMALVTYACRVSGVVMMSRFRITQPIERALRALPGCIVVATILPLAVDGGPAAMLALGATILAMSLTGIELVAITAGLACVAALRALGI
jgi:uncharacterized membrane protein